MKSRVTSGFISISLSLLIFPVLQRLRNAALIDLYRRAADVIPWHRFGPEPGPALDEYPTVDGSSKATYQACTYCLADLPVSSIGGAYVCAACGQRLGFGER